MQFVCLNDEYIFFFLKLTRGVCVKQEHQLLISVLHFTLTEEKQLICSLMSIFLFKLKEYILNSCNPHGSPDN